MREGRKKGRRDEKGGGLYGKFFITTCDTLSTWEKMTGALAYEIEIRLPIGNRPIHFPRRGEFRFVSKGTRMLGEKECFSPENFEIFPSEKVPFASRYLIASKRNEK